MTQDDQKRAVAHEALQYVVTDGWIGVGSGSTANYFIDELAKIKGRIKGAVASSVKTADRLKARHAVILGEDELAAGVVAVKRLADGTQQKLAEQDLFSYLRAARDF